MYTIAIVNQKGGVSKTTTALALYEGLKDRGYRTLFIDLDFQRNASNTLRADTQTKTILGVLLKEVQAIESIQAINGGNVIPANRQLANMDILLQETGKEYRLREMLEPLKDMFDYCIIDTPPALNILTINALVTSNEIIIPSLTDIYSLQGIIDLQATINTIKKYCNESLTVGGILLTRYNSRTIMGKQALATADKIAKSLNSKVFKTKIREGIAIKETQLKRIPIFSLLKANPVKDYLEFIDEFMEGRK